MVEKGKGEVGGGGGGGGEFLDLEVVVEGENGEELEGEVPVVRVRRRGAADEDRGTEER